jgi:hypothetical protein
MAAAKKTPKPNAKPVNKSAFVRSMPTTMPAKELIARAKTKGFKLTAAYVYSIRAKANAAARKKGSQAKRPGRPPKTASSSPSHAGGSVSSLEQLITEIVERRVVEILQSKMGAFFGN